MTCGQVWWPILGICALHLTHPSAHTQQWTHTWSSGQPMLWRPGSSWGFGALLKGLTSVVVLKVERALDIHSPHQQSLPDLRLEPTTFGLQVDSLSIRPRLPPLKVSDLKKFWLFLWTESKIEWNTHSQIIQACVRSQKSERALLPSMLKHTRNVTWWQELLLQKKVWT